MRFILIDLTVKLRRLALTMSATAQAYGYTRSSLLGAVGSPASDVRVPALWRLIAVCQLSGPQLPEFCR